MTNLYASSRPARYAAAALGDYLGRKAAGIKDPAFVPSILPDSCGISTRRKEK